MPLGEGGTRRSQTPFTAGLCMSVPTAVAPSQRYWDPPIAFPWVPIGPFLDVSWIPHVGHAAGRVGAWACPPAGAAHPRGASRSPCRARPCGTWPGPSCLRRFPGYLAAVQPVLGELCSSVAPRAPRRRAYCGRTARLARQTRAGWKRAGRQHGLEDERACAARRCTSSAERRGDGPSGLTVRGC